MKEKTRDNTLNQGIGSYIGYINSLRADELQRVLVGISENLKEELSQNDINLIKAMKYVDNVRDFISNPSGILGSDLTKHGEIAEQIEVNISNAKAIVSGLKEKFTFDGVGRTAPEDYLDGVKAVQSKFCNGITNTLKAILDHKDKNQSFGTNGGDYYNIPKDQYEIMIKILNKENLDDINEKTVRTVSRLIKEIESKSDRPIKDLIKPSISDYSDVQNTKASETLDNHETSLKNQSDDNKNAIKNRAKDEEAKSIDNSGPSMSEAAKVTAVSAVISGGISFAISIGKKKKEGKNISEFTADDWKDVGIDTGKGSIKGGITGLSVYTLTNFTKTPAPLASAYVSASFGIVNLAKQYKDGEITSSDFIENSQLVCMDSAISAMGATLGTFIIPVPVLGAVVGSIVANTMSSIGKDYLDGSEQKLIEDYNKKYIDEISKLENEHVVIISKIMQGYYILGEISTMAFDFNLNAKLRFENSIGLAKAYEVKESEILKDHDDIARYFLD